MQISNFVCMTSYEITPMPSRLPPYLWKIFTGLTQVHGVWRHYRRAALYSNPDNFAQLLSGHALKLACGQSTLLKIAAQSLLIATRLLACAQQQAALAHEGKMLMAAIKGHYPAPLTTRWITNQSCVWMSPSAIYYWKCLGMEAYQRLIRIAHSIMQICQKTFLFSMCILDTIDAFYVSPINNNEAITESCLNVITWLDTLVDKKEELLIGFTENREIIEKILMHSSFSYPQLLTAVTTALDSIETLQQHTKKITSFGNGVILEFGKRSLHGAMVVTGLKTFYNLYFPQQEVRLAREGNAK